MAIVSRRFFNAAAWQAGRRERGRRSNAAARASRLAAASALCKALRLGSKLSRTQRPGSSLFRFRNEMPSGTLLRVPEPICFYGDLYGETRSRTKYNIVGIANRERVNSCAQLDGTGRQAGPWQGPSRGRLSSSACAAGCRSRAPACRPRAARAGPNPASAATWRRAASHPSHPATTRRIFSRLYGGYMAVLNQGSPNKVLFVWCAENP